MDEHEINGETYGQINEEREMLIDCILEADDREERACLISRMRDCEDRMSEFMD
jgi:hypothetical protein